jgi:hypothetical protein
MQIGGERGATKDVAAAHTVPNDGGPRAPAAAETDGPSAFARILHGLGREVDHGEKVVRRAVSGGGKDLGPGELLALQAGVYRYSEAVDLSAKLVDRATSGVKTVLQGQ